MKIVLYTFNYRKNDIVKNLNNSKTFNDAYLRYPTNFLNPIIRIDMGELALDDNNTIFPTYNYAYIEEFNARYYFIENIVAISNNIFDLYLHVDVLYTYIGKTNAIMRSQSAFITRSEDNNLYNKWYVDDRVSFENLDTIEYSELTSTTTGIEFKDFGNTQTSQHNIIMSIGNQRTDYSNTTGDLNPFTNNSSSFDYRCIGSDCGYTVYAFRYDQAHQFLKECIADDTKAQHIRYISVLPFEIPAGDLILDNNTGLVKYGTSSQSFTFSGYADLNVYKTKRSVERYHFFTKKLTTSITGMTDFTKTDNYAKYSIFVPFAGWVDLESYRLKDEPTLSLYYDINFDNGLVNFVITLDGELYINEKCNMGINIAPNTSNAYENKKQEDANILSGAAGYISGLMMMIAGVMLSIGTEGAGSPVGVPMAIAGASAMGTSGFMTQAKNHALVDLGSKGSSTSTNGLFVYDKVILRIIYKQTSFPMSTAGAWLSENGRPVLDNATISSLRGYTEFGKTEFSVGNVEEEKELEDLTMSGVHFPSNTW